MLTSFVSSVSQTLLVDCLCSGYATDGLRRVIQGDRVGSLFHRDAKQWVSVSETGARVMAVAARNASRRLQSLSPSERRQALLDVADALVQNEALIRAENEADLQAAQQSRISASLLGRLTIKPGKVHTSNRNSLPWGCVIVPSVPLHCFHFTEISRPKTVFPFIIKFS